MLLEQLATTREGSLRNTRRRRIRHAGRIRKGLLDLFLDLFLDPFLELGLFFGLENAFGPGGGNRDGHSPDLLCRVPLVQRTKDAPYLVFLQGGGQCFQQLGILDGRLDTG